MVETVIEMVEIVLERDSHRDGRDSVRETVIEMVKVVLERQSDGRDSVRERQSYRW